MFRATSALFLATLSLCAAEDRVFTPATTGLRGSSDVSSVEGNEAAAVDLKAVVSAPFLASKAKLILDATIPSDLMTRTEDLELEDSAFYVYDGVSYSAETSVKDCRGGDWHSLSMQRLGACFPAFGLPYYFKPKAYIGEKTTTTKYDIYTTPDCTGTPLKKGVRLSRYHNCKDGNDHTYSITGALDGDATSAVVDSGEGLLITTFLDDTCSSPFSSTLIYAYKCLPSHDDKTGKISAHYIYTNVEFEGGQIKISARVYSKDDSFCRLKFQDIDVTPYGTSLTTNCQSIDSGIYWKADAQLSGNE